MKERALLGVDFNLYLITGRKQCGGRELAASVEEALMGGVKAVQLREKDLSSRELYELAYAMRKLTARYNAKLFINDRADIALAVNADGIHLGGASLPVHRARRVIGNKKLIGVSCHNQMSATAAEEAGADFITFGPVFSTPSKVAFGPPVGIAKLADVAKLLRIPVFALGGINRGNVHEPVAAGCSRIALISAILAAANPREEARELLSLLPADTVPKD